MIIGTVVTLIASLILNNYVLEALLFPGNTFLYVNLFTVAELFFLTYCINVFMSLKVIGLLFKALFNKEARHKSPRLRKELQQVSWPIFPAMIIFGLLSGIVIYLLTQGYSMAACIARSTLLSAFWGLIYWYCWRCGYLFWFYDFFDDDEDDEEQSRTENKKAQALNQTS